MRVSRSITKLGTAAEIALGCVATTSACSYYGYDAAEWAMAPEAPPEAPCVADPATGKADCDGVFVSVSLGDDEHPGTRDQPVLSMKRAIALARDGSKRVYACAETFAEPVALPAGVALWGGLDCANAWSYVGATDKTIVAPTSGAIPLRMTPGDGVSVVADLRAEAAGAKEASGSSIAAMAMTGAVVEILRSELVAGDGADGAWGATGGEQPAQSGAPGNSGAGACSAEVVEGALSVVTLCDGTESLGGKGGDGAIASGGPGNHGQPEPIPNPAGWGLGGFGERGIPCQPGQMGLNGTDGDHGLGAIGVGRITLTGWEGLRGKDGGDGLPAQGGGGGGGSRGGAALCGFGINRGGASGGSGGTGGCGGKGGEGGGYGGSSIGLLTFSGDVTLSATTLVTGKGGNGGIGGLAQVGGVGGPGGAGGLGFSMAKVGCEGGNGGQGGGGGHGGGGLGGSSMGIAHLFGATPKLQGDIVIQTSAAGKGGFGGNRAIPNSTGEDGLRGDLVAFPVASE